MKKFDRNEFLNLITNGWYYEAKEYDLRGANLRDANLDFSCWPLWCGSLGVKVDKRIACQLAYHFCSVVCDDPEYIEARNKMLSFANQFHLVEECGELVEV